MIVNDNQQSVTSRLETSRYRDFSQFFESICLGLENFGLEKSLGISLDEIFWSRHSVVIHIMGFVSVLASSFFYY